MGTVIEINLADEQLGPTWSVSTVHALKGRGLEGDRILRMSEESGEPVEPKRQVTLIELEALEALARDCDIELSAAESRRNIATRGVALNHLVGHEFRIGGARLRGIELCEPCATLEKHVGLKGLIAGLIHRGGLRAQVIQGGIIAVGDMIDCAPDDR